MHVFCVTRKTAAVPKYRNINVSLLRNLARLFCIVTPKPCVARQACPWMPLSRLWRDCGMTTVDKKDHPNLDSFSQLTQSFVFVRTSSKTFLAV